MALNQVEQLIVTMLHFLGRKRKMEIDFDDNQKKSCAYGYTTAAVVYDFFNSNGEPWSTFSA